MSTVRTGLLAGLAVQFALLAGLAATVGLGVAGWLAGLAYGGVLCGLLWRGLHVAGTDRLGPADRVTLARALLVGGVLALVVPDGAGPAPVSVVVPLAAVALALDGVDGPVARRTGTASPLGARFDMEVDAFLILVLSVLLAPAVGGWVLAIGGMRYAFVAVGRVLPWMRAALPPRFWRKVVAAAQGVLLTVSASHLVPPVAGVALVAAALALLVESFGHDVAWLWRHRRAAIRPSAPPTAAPVRASAPPTRPAAPPVRVATTPVRPMPGPAPAAPPTRIVLEFAGRAACAAGPAARPVPPAARVAAPV